MGIFKQRKKSLEIRKIKNTMEYANVQIAKKVEELNKSKIKPSCPICKLNEHVDTHGSYKGIKKWICNNSNCLHTHFSTTTSYEANEIYRTTMIDNLMLLTYTGSTVDGIRKYNETSKYFVEYVTQALYEHIISVNSKIKIPLELQENYVLILFDLSGAKISKNKAIILAKVEDKIIFEIVTHSNNLSTYKVLASIKAKFDIPKKTQVIFVTDGEKGFVDSIIYHFPNAIHIRQFHGMNSKGIIYTHFSYKKKYYTIRHLWNIVLKEGEASKQVVKQREFLANKKIAKKEQKNAKVKYSKLSSDVIVFEGIVYEPRGVRRILHNKKKGDNQDTKDSKMQNKEKENTINEEVEKSSANTNTSGTDTAKVIYKGTLEGVKKLEVFNFYYLILRKVFGGLYITSNAVETIFNVKSKLAQHRTMKCGERILICILFMQTVLRNLKKPKLRNFFKEKIITYDFIQNNVLYGSGLQKNKAKEPTFLEIITKAIKEKKQIVIKYMDKFRKMTTRVVRPIETKMNDYNNAVILKAFCTLRNANRSFCLKRIKDVAIYELKPIVI